MRQRAEELGRNIARNPNLDCKGLILQTWFGVASLSGLKETRELIFQFESNLAQLELLLQQKNLLLRK